MRAGAQVANSEDLVNAPAGDYTLIVTDGAGCTASVDFTLTETVANKDLASDFFTEIFPNPASERAWLAVAFPKPLNLYLNLCDASGKVLQAWTVKGVTEQNIPLDLKGLAAGAYRLRIWTGDRWLSETIVVL